MKGIRTTLHTAACLVGLALILAASPAAADHVILDDCIIDGSLCVGFDCVNGESFGFDTIRLKEHNLRIDFNDTSSAPSFPTNNWGIVINDSANGGASYFGVEDRDAGRMVFRVFAGARANALVVDSGGDLGLGTSTPSVDIHVKTGDTPTLRLEQDGTSGFQPQIWDVAGNETNFFVRDVTNGSQLPIRSRPDAPTSSIDVANDGDVGMGTASPDTALHVVRTSTGTTFARVTNSNASAQTTGFTMENSSSIYSFNVNTQGDMQLTESGSGVAEFEIDSDATGNTPKFEFRDEVQGSIMEIQADGDVNSKTGSFGTISDRNAKTDITPVDPREVLAKVSALPISTWRYKKNSDELHMGPMGQDFWAAFGLHEGPTSVSISDLSGVALAAVQGLTQEIEELRARLAELEAQLAE